MLTRRSLLSTAGAGLIALPMGGAAFAQALASTPLASAGVNAAAGPVTHEIQSLNKDPNDPKQQMVFSPPVLKINPGDTVNLPGLKSEASGSPSAFRPV